MSKDANEDGFLSRWSKRKQSAVDQQVDEPEAANPVEAEVQVEPETEEEALAQLHERDPELAEQVSAIDIDAMSYDDDFSVFMNSKVPEFIRRKALSKLWLSNPILANVDGLNDYDEDFRDVSDIVGTLQSALGKETDEAEGEADEVVAQSDAGTAAPEDGEQQDADAVDDVAGDDQEQLTTAEDEDPEATSVVT